MAKKMLVNTIDEEESRMAIVEGGKLVEFNIQMSVRTPIIGNIYKAVVRNVERGLQAAFVDFGAVKNGFLPLHDVSPEYFQHDNGKRILKVGQELLIQVLREQKNHKGAMLTTYISLPARYLVLMPQKRSAGISRKVDSDDDRDKLRSIMDKVVENKEMGFIVRTAGANRTKQELQRDYQILLRLWKDIKKKAEKTSAPALIYHESDFAVRSLRDYFTSDINEIVVDDVNTFHKMRDYFKAVSPRNVRMIKHYREETPIFHNYEIEEQIDEIYQERANLTSGGYLIIVPTEAMITIDVNSGRASSRRDVEETALKTNLEAVEEIARQLRLRDLGGLVIIDFIDMRDRKHISQVEKAFKKSLSLDRARIQMSRISRFGLMELSRQRKQTAIQEVSYTSCPHCHGTGLRPSLEYMALGTFRRIKSAAVKRMYATINVDTTREVTDYLLNQKRKDMSDLESLYDVSIHISGDPDIRWGESSFELVERETPVEKPPKEELDFTKMALDMNESEGTPKKKSASRNRRPYRRRKRKPSALAEAPAAVRPEEDAPKGRDTEEPVKNGAGEMGTEETPVKKKRKMSFFDIFRG